MRNRGPALPGPVIDRSLLDLADEFHHSLYELQPLPARAPETEAWRSFMAGSISPAAHSAAEMRVIDA